MLSPVMSQVMTMAKIWLQEQRAEGRTLQKVKEREGSERCGRPAAMVAIEAGLATANHVHM